MNVEERMRIRMQENDKVLLIPGQTDRSWDSSALRRVIEETGVKVADLAAAMGVAKQSMYTYVSGANTPSVRLLVALADYFALPTDVLLNRCSEEDLESIKRDYKSCFDVLVTAACSVYAEKAKTDELHVKDGCVPPYPLNLWLDIFGEGNVALCLKEQEEALEEAVDSLGEREKLCVRNFYREGMTLKEAGECVGVGPERARQIIAKGVRKLRHPARSKRIRYGKTLFEAEAQMIEQQKAEEYRKRIENTVSDASREKKRGPWPAYYYDPITAIGIGTHGRNLMLRNGIKTAGQLAVMFDSVKDMMSIRGMGRATLIEIAAALDLHTGGNEFTERAMDYFSKKKGESVV